jgi:Rod binding domain-containing protein
MSSIGMNSLPLLDSQASITQKGTGSSSKIHDAAQQFETLMVGEMLKSVREGSSEGWLGSGDEAGSDSAMDMAQAQFARAFTMGGGLGLSASIERSLSHEAAGQNVAAVPAKLSSGS